MPMDEFKRKVLATYDKPKMIKAVFLKSHVRGYFRRNGGYWAPHERRTGAAGPSPGEFVLSPAGGRDFGEITPEIAHAIKRQPGKIRLEVGEHKGAHKGFGANHIKADHPDIKDIPAFVADVASSFDQVWKTRGGRLKVVKRLSGSAGRVAVIELRPHEHGDYYSVVTAFRARTMDGDALLWDAAQSRPAGFSGDQPALGGPQSENAGEPSLDAKQKEGIESIAQKDENDNPKMIKSVVLFKSSGTPSVGDKIEFLSDSLTDKGPSSGVVTGTKTTVDGAYLRVRHSDTEEWMSWEDLRPHARKKGRQWLIKSYVKPHRRVTKAGKVVFVSGYRNKVVPKAKGGSSRPVGDAKTADMFSAQDKEDGGAASVWVVPERSTDDERLLSNLPGGARFAQGKTVLNKGKWTVLIDDKMAGNWRDTKEDAVRDAENSIAAKERFVLEAAERKNRASSVAQKLLAGGEPTDADIKFLGLKNPAGFKWLSPVVQELFGISRAKVRAAMGDALRESRSDMGVVYWVANPKRALLNAAAYARNAP